MRVINEVWTGVGFAIERGQQQRTTPEGLPLMRPDGTPDLEQTTVLMFVLDDGPTLQRIIRVPFGEEGTEKLKLALTGGVIPATSLRDLGL